MASHRPTIVVYSRPRLALRAVRRLALGLCCAGCDPPPQAPVLRDSPVYQNESAGFRFRVPDGWSQTANSALPAGDLPREIFVARYRVLSQDGGASLQVLARNDVPTDRLAAHLQQPAFGVMQWTVVEPLQTLNVAGRPADRVVLSSAAPGKTLIQHATCFHHRGRLFAFVGLYWKTDPTVRQQIERAVDSILWE